MQMEMSQPLRISVTNRKTMLVFYVHPNKVKAKVHSPLHTRVVLYAPPLTWLLGKYFW